MRSLRPYTRSPVARVRGSMLLRAVSQASVRNKVESKMTDMTTTRATARDRRGRARGDGDRRATWPHIPDAQVITRTRVLKIRLE